MAHNSTDSHGSKSTPLWLIVVVVVGVIVVIGALVLPSRVRDSVAKKRDVTLSINNLRQLVMIQFMERKSRPRPALTGKAFVLSPLARGLIDRRNSDKLIIFFSPADPDRQADSVPRERWSRVTIAALKRGESFDDLTSYAGPAARSTSSGMGAGPHPMLADVHFSDRAIVAFTDGSVRSMSREELGLGPDDAIRVGPDSTSPILRQLSDE